MPTPRRLLQALLALGASAATTLALAAAPYPSKPVTLLLGYPPGSATDFLARLIAPRMAEGLGQPVVVENKPGAAGVLAAQGFVSAPPDGYTMMMTVPGPMTVAKAIQQDKLPYSPENDFRAVGFLGGSPLLLVVPADSGIKTAQEWLEKARSTPGGMDVASYGVGSPSHFAVEMLRLKNNLPITHIPYNGSAALQTAVVGKIVPSAVDSVTAGLPLIESGRIIPLAITASQRLDALPDVPTAAEAGLGEIVLGGWAGLHVPKGTPDAIVQRLNEELNRVLALPEVRTQIGPRLVIVGGPPEVMDRHIRDETAQLTELIKTGNIKFE